MFHSPSISQLTLTQRKCSFPSTIFYKERKKKKRISRKLKRLNDITLVGFSKCVSVHGVLTASPAELKHTILWQTPLQWQYESLSGYFTILKKHKGHILSLNTTITSREDTWKTPIWKTELPGLQQIVLYWSLSPQQGYDIVLHIRGVIFSHLQ